MKVKYLSIANSEYREAIDYYNEEQTGLGYEFAIEVDEAIERIKVHPNAWEKVSERARRCLLKRFPYAIYYKCYDEELVVFAIIHTHRDSKHWEERL